MNIQSVQLQIVPWDGIPGCIEIIVSEPNIIFPPSLGYVPVILCCVMSCGLIKIKQDNLFIPVKVKNIIRLEGEKGGYTYIFLAGGTSYKVCGSIGEWEKDKEIASSGLFIRVHSSHLVNWSQVQFYDSLDGVTMNDKSNVPVTAKGMNALEKKIYLEQLPAADMYIAMARARTASFRHARKNKLYAGNEEG